MAHCTPLHRWTLAALLLGSPGARACDPVPPPPEVTQAQRELEALGTPQRPCPAPAPLRTWQSCRAYRAPAERVAALLGVIHAAKVTRSAQGVTVTVEAVGEGAQVMFRRVVTTDEQLRQDLTAALTGGRAAFDAAWLPRLLTLLRPPTCAQLGVRDTDWYRLHACEVVPRRDTPHSTLRNEPFIRLTLAWAADRTVPADFPLRFGYTGNTCTLYEYF